MGKGLPTNINGERRAKGRRCAVRIVEMISAGEGSGLEKRRGRMRAVVTLVRCRSENEIRANLCLRRKEREENTNLPLSGSGERMGHLKGF